MSLAVVQVTDPLCPEPMLVLVIAVPVDVARIHTGVLDAIAVFTRVARPDDGHVPRVIPESVPVDVALPV